MKEKRDWKFPGEDRLARQRKMRNLGVGVAALVFVLGAAIGLLLGALLMERRMERDLRERELTPFLYATVQDPDGVRRPKEVLVIPGVTCYADPDLVDELEDAVSPAAPTGLEVKSP